MIEPMFRATVTITTLLLALTGCGGEDDAPDRPASKETARNGDVYSAADVEFATTMIPLHAEALAMVDVAMTKELSPAAQGIADDIQLTGTPQVQEMTSWLNDWDEPIPETVRDHVNAGHDDEHGEDHEAASDELARLEAAEGADFEELWVDLVLGNQREALAAAETQQEEGTFAPAVELADSIATGHTERIEALTALGGG